MTTTDPARVTFSGEDPALDVTYHLSDPVQITLIRVDLLLLAGAVKRLADHEMSVLYRLISRTERQPQREESQRWKAGQRIRLYEQLRAAAGPMFEPDYPETKRREREEQTNG